MGGRGVRGAVRASIDLGTQTALLAVARVRADGTLEELDDRAAAVRLGEGLARTGRLDDAAIERALAALAGFVEVVAARGIAAAEVDAVATAVLRRASDAGRFVRRAREELGLAFRVVSGEEEARLSWIGAAGPGAPASIRVLDVGGGSSELCWDAGRERRSAPIGAVLLTETWLGREGRPAERAGGWTGLSRAVREACAVFPSAREGAAAAEVVAVGGTACNLACLARGESEFTTAAIEGTRVEAAEVAEWAERLARATTAERARLPIEPSRRDILPAGLACVAGVLERIGAGEIRIRRRGLRHGVLLAARADGSSGESGASGVRPVPESDSTR